MADTITAFYTFEPKELIRSARVNTNFSNFRGDLVPINTNTATASDLTHDLGQADHRWQEGYVSSLNLGGTTTSWNIKDATTSVGNLVANLNGTQQWALMSGGSQVLNQLSTSPSASVVTGTAQLYVKDDGKGYLRTIDGETELGSGGSGVYNYFTGGDFESNADLASTYDDAGAFVDGTGGSPTIITVSRNTTTPLVDDGDLKVSKSAADGSGEGCVLTSNTINSAHRGRRLWISFEWDGSDANYTSGDLALKAYDVGASAELHVYPVGGVLEDGTLPDYKTKVLAYVITSSSTTGAVRVALHLGSDSATGSAWDCYVDDAQLSPEATVPGSIVTEWVAFTPTGTWSTNTTYVGFKRRVGNNEQIYVRATTSGAPDATTLIIDLPSTMDTGKLHGTSDGTKLKGDGHARNSSTASYSKLAVEYVTSTTVALQCQGASGTYLVDVGGVSNTLPFTFGASDYVEFWAEYPVSGWSAGAMLSTTETNLSTVKARYKTDAGQSIPNNTSTIINFEDVDYDTHDTVTTGGSWKFTAPKTGYYRVETHLLFSATTTWAEGEVAQVVLHKNGAIYSYLDRNTQFGATSTYMHISGGDTVYLEKGDYIDLRVTQTSGAALTLISDGTLCRVSIEESPDFSTFSVWGETVLVEGNSSTFANFTSTSWANITTISLTPGEWDIAALVVYKNNGASVLTNSYMAVSAYSATTTTDHVAGKNIASLLCHADNGGEFSLVIPKFTVSISSTTTYYLKGVHNNGTNKQVIYSISARRIK